MCSFFVAQTTPLVGSILEGLFVLYPPFRGIGFIPLEPGVFYPWQLVSYMFLHGSIGHLFFNLFALWIFGQQIEAIWGTRRFVTYYFLCGIGAALLHMLVAPKSGYRCLRWSLRNLACIRDAFSKPGDLPAIPAHPH